jgi:hypothetical protein
MSDSWQELAQRKRPAEDRLIEQYRKEFFKGDLPSSGRGYEVSRTPWGVARRFFPAMYLASIGRRSAWPETQVVLKLFFEFAPGRRVIGMRGIWPPGRWDAPDPPHNDMFGMNLAESIQKHAGRWLAAQQGPIAYFIWSTPVDRTRPPAPGNPPPELLTARAEVDRIRCAWARFPNS